MYKAGYFINEGNFNATSLIDKDIFSKARRFPNKKLGIPLNDIIIKLYIK